MASCEVKLLTTVGTELGALGTVLSQMLLWLQELRLMEAPP